MFVSSTGRRIHATRTWKRFRVGCASLSSHRFLRDRSPVTLVLELIFRRSCNGLWVLGWIATKPPSSRYTLKENCLQWSLGLGMDCNGLIV